jgi:hypothetical protein
MTIASARKEIINEISQIQDITTLETVNYYLKHRIMPNNLTSEQLIILRESDAQYNRNEIKDNAVLFTDLDKWLEKK